MIGVFNNYNGIVKCMYVIVIFGKIDIFFVMKYVSFECFVFVFFLCNSIFLENICIFGVVEIRFIVMVVNNVILGVDLKFDVVERIL